MRARQPARVLGPYQEDSLWRVVSVDERGRRKSHTASSRQAANRLLAKLQAALKSRSVEVAVEEWRAARHRAGASRFVDYETDRVRAVLNDVLDKRLDELTERRAAALYEQTATEPSGKTGQPLHAASHRAYLAYVKTFWRWAVRQGYTSSSPWEAVAPIGRVATGKPQLRRQEARRFVAVAEAEAAAGSGLALATLCCLSLGVRASEALHLTARDVDAEASEVYVSGTKSSAARRRLELPPYLCALLGSAASIRQPTERLCEASRQTLHTYVVALCARAGVPRVCIHGLRGTHASLAVSGGASVEAVARALGHTSTKMTLEHYITDDAATGARLAAVDASLKRG